MQRDAGLNLAASGAALLAAVVVSLLFLSAPATIEERLALAIRGVSAQRPDHSFLADGRPQAMEARMLGIFVGFAGVVATSWIGGRARRVALPGGGKGAVCLLFVLVLGADGVNALLFGSGGPALYVPRNELRLTTGLLGGLGVAAFAAPVVHSVLQREQAPAPFYGHWRELLGDVALVGATGVFVALGGTWAASALAFLAVMLSFSFVNAYLWVLLGLQGPAESWRVRGWLLACSVALAILELAGLAAVRTLVDG